MHWRELSIAGAWEITPRQFADPRGVFLELFKHAEILERTGRPFEIAQTNLSTSTAGVVRGVHFSAVPPGQAKYVTCVRGAVLDVVVDIRTGSPTFGQWDAVLLDDVDRRATFVPEGLGHAFCSLEDGSTVTYLCSTGYAPDREHGVNPFDEALAIEWPTTGRDGSPLTLERSEKDEVAPSLAAAARLGLLPSFEEVSRFIASLNVERED